MQNNTINKIKGLLNISNKAGYLIIGADNLKGYTKKLYLIIQSDAGGKNLSKIVNETKNNTCCETIILCDSDFKDIVSISNCKVVGLKNKGISEEVLKYLRGENIG